MRIISCGVEGVERGALFGANKVGLQTGGWAPCSIITPAWNAEYPKWVDLCKLQLSKRGDWWACAKRNIEEADGVLLLGPRNTERAQLVIGHCKKPVLKLRCQRSNANANKLVWQARMLASWTYNNDIAALYTTGEEDHFLEGWTEAMIITAHQEIRRPGCLPDRVVASRRKQRLYTRVANDDG